MTYEAAAASKSVRRPPFLRFATAPGCTWRALYVSRQATNVDYAGRDWGRSWHQFFHVGIDPETIGRGPTLLGAFVNPWNRRGFVVRWNIRLPHLRWKHDAGPLYSAAYGVTSRFWNALNGRFGALRPGVIARMRARLNDMEQRRPCLYAWGLVLSLDALLIVALLIAKPFA